MRKISALIIMLIVILVIVACGNRQEDIDNGRPENGRPITEGISQTYDYENYAYSTKNIQITRMNFLSGMLTHNERIYYWGRNQDWEFVLTSIDAEGHDLQQTKIRAAHVISLTITEEGNIAFLEEHQEWIEPIMHRRLYYVEVGLNGTEVIRHDFGDIDVISQGSQRVNITGAAFSDRGSVAVTAQCSRDGVVVYLLNTESDNVTKLDLSTPYSGEKNIITLQDGRVVVLDTETDKAVFREIDFVTQNWKESFSLAENINNTAYRLFETNEHTPFDLLMSTQNHLYGYSFATSEKTLLINWVESEIVFVENEFVGMLPDGRFAMLSGGWNWNTQYGWDGELVVLSPISRTELPERTVITLGGMDISPSVRLAVVKFNRQNQAYTIRVNDYMAGGWQSDIAGLQRLHIEMVTGTGPDILFAGEMGSISVIADRGLLLDLYPLIEADSEISKTDFFPNVLFTLENPDGSLPLISNKFTIETVIGTREKLGHIGSWTPADMRDFIERNINSPHIFGEWVDSESFLQNVILFSGSELIDWDTYTANFNNADFIQTLEIARLLPSSMPSVMRTWSIEELYKGTMLFDITWLSSVERFQDYADLLGDIVVLGMPTAEGGAHIIDTREQFGINATTDHADFAWMFIRDFLLQTAEIENGFPMRIDLYDAMITEAMKIRTRTDDNGRIVEIPRVQFIWLSDEEGRGGVEVSLYALSENTAELLRSIIESARGRGRLSPEIMEFIMGDFASFATGIRSAEDTARIIQSRVQIWLSEQELIYGGR
jgi:hypothetical protein